MDEPGSDGKASNLSKVAAKSKARTLPSKRRARRAWAVLAIVAVSIGFLLYKGLGNSLVYFRTAAGAWKDRAQLGSSTFRLEGVVVPGSIHTLNGGVDFAVESSNVSVEVHDTANPPQLFQPNIPVVLVGHFSGSVFQSTQIMVKHSSNYIAAHPNRVATVNGKKL